jgi:homoserine dehydrogenase
MKSMHRILFEKIGEEGDDKLAGHTVSVVGLGTVGSQVADILAREDFDLRLIDRGRVEEVDMGRLSLFQEEDITKFKVKQAKRRLEAINPRVKVKSFHEDLHEQNVFLVKSEFVIDATNQPEVNKLIFDYCQENKIPLLILRYSESKAKLLVANKKITAKQYDWIEDTGNVTEEGIYSGCVLSAAAHVITQVYKFFLGDTASYQIALDSWDFDNSITKL